ncbi:uncharacterized protein N7500_009303 [Penicillium coprophilum]|uniref:uncharacterized protein n=1 Tax=Penicillium coprophilum TaxID=36646 RepID=UPI00239F0F04|nr:uncharacterized protein N7500_009303 [Penicillium coprophilum]KAJ5153864.1 hypothetical protein N7500_009303 [Penicillium coprophilum]
MTSILFVPGAWITPAFYQPFIHALTVASYDVHYGGYPSLNPKDPLVADCQADTEAITDILQSLVDEGKDVVVFMHSYGGMPGSAAASGLAKSQRVKEGKSGGVIGLLYLGAFIPSPNVNVVDDPIKNFAADVDPVLANSLTRSLKPHSNLAFTSPQPHPAWADEAFNGRLGFIVTTEDAAVPKAAQSGMMAATEKAWIVKEVASSHCAPFLNRIGETVELIREIIDQFL